MSRPCCRPVYWQHDAGWDVYPRSSCYKINGAWVPRWFDDFIVEDCPTRENARRAVAELHPFGICLAQTGAPA